MKGFAVIFLLFFIAVTSGIGINVRDPKWFNRQTKTVTKYLKMQHVVTEATPSSCVVVQTSLPPCRHLRALPIQPSATTWIVPTQAPIPSKSSMEQNWQPVMQPSDPLPSSPTPPLRVKGKPEAVANPATGQWDWDFFNLSPKDVTVTKTIKEVFTTKYYDPNTVVTFSVKGCRPSRLPFDLPECKIDEMIHEPIPERNVIVMAPVQFIPSLDEIILPAKSESPPKVMEQIKKEEDQKETS